MAPRREAEPIEKKIVNLYKGDFGLLQDLHPRLGASKVIRELVRAHIKRAQGVVNSPITGEL